MSSIILETRLEPDRRLRFLLLGSSLLILLTGVILVLQLPVGPWLRALIVVIWIADVCRQMARLCAGMARVTRLSLDSSGRIIAAGPDGDLQKLTLLAGSVVTARLAWLRLRFPDDSVYAELLCGDAGCDPHWHRLQLIWQQSACEFSREPKG
jgi:hypothetical protein